MLSECVHVCVCARFGVPRSSRVDQKTLRRKVGIQSRLCRLCVRRKARYGKKKKIKKEKKETLPSPYAETINIIAACRNYFQGR